MEIIFSGIVLGLAMIWFLSIPGIALLFVGSIKLAHGQSDGLVGKFAMASLLLPYLAFVVLVVVADSRDWLGIWNEEPPFVTSCFRALPWIHASLALLFVLLRRRARLAASLFSAGTMLTFLAVFVGTLAAASGEL